VITSVEGCLAYACDESDQESVAPNAVVLACSADDIARALAVAAEVEVPSVSIDARAGTMLLIEVGGDPPVCEPAMERLGGVCAEVGALDVLVAQDPAQRDRLWDARRQLSPATRAMARYKISGDVVVRDTTTSSEISSTGSVASPKRPPSRCSATATAATGSSSSDHTPSRSASATKRDVVSCTLSPSADQ